MKLSRLTVENFQGVRALDIAPAAPVLLVAGHNHAGKSSLIEAIRCAFNGSGERLKLKKEMPSLITDGAKKGRISVFMDGEPIAGLTLPGGDHVENLPADITLPKLNAVLDAQRFAAGSADDRRGLLFDITGRRATAALVSERLAARGADEKRIQTIIPMLRSGFPAAAKDAADRAKDAKGAWRGVTGETYGEKKADGWEASKPDVDASLQGTLQESLSGIDARLAAAQQDLGSLRTRYNQAMASAGKLVEWKEKAEKVERIRSKLATDEAELTTWNEKVAKAQAAAAAPDVCNCPSCDALLEIKSGALMLAGERAADPALAAQLGEYTKARDSYARAVDADRRDLTDAEHAVKMLAEAGDTETVAEADIQAKQQEVSDLQSQRNDINQQLNDLRLTLSMAANADMKTKEAAQHHADVTAWALIADSLSPDGIPGELLAEALAPVNSLLETLSREAGWKKVQISTDISVTADGRAYALLSESEKWRCDAVLAIAIANLSGIRFVMLDRFDVLDIDGRGQLIGLLDYVTDEQLIDSAVIAGTMKSAPGGLSENFHPIWMEAGKAIATEEQKVA